MTEELRQLEADLGRFRRLQPFWLDPTRRYRRSRSVAGELLSTRIGLTRGGRYERVRQASDPAGRRLLLNEFDALSKVRHENLVELAWAGRRRSTIHVATRWVATEESTERVRSPVPLTRLLRQFVGIARGVAALHEAGLVHGDLKPQNLLFETEGVDGGRGLVADLKFAAPAGRRRDASLTPKFAAPEQILDEEVGPPADIYALGVSLYALFVRDRFPALLAGGADATEIPGSGGGPVLSAVTSIGGFEEAGGDRPTESIIGAKVEFKSRLGRVTEGVEHAGLMADLLEIIRRSTALDPGARYPDVAALGQALEDLLGRAE